MKTTHFRNKLNEDEQHYNGLGMSPRPTNEHQNLIMAIGDGIRKHFAEEKTDTKYQITYEVELGEPNSVAPDLVVFLKGTSTPVFALEIEKTKGISGTCKKVKTKVFPLFPTVVEVIIYNYEKGVFYRVFKNGKKNKAIRSTFLGTTLKKLIRPNMISGFVKKNNKNEKAIVQKDKEIERLKKLLAKMK